MRECGFWTNMVILLIQSLCIFCFVMSNQMIVLTNSDSKEVLFVPNGMPFNRSLSVLELWWMRMLDHLDHIYDIMFHTHKVDKESPL